MKSFIGFAVGLVALTATTSAISAGVCDYRPSRWLGDAGAASAETAAASVATAGIGLQAAGFYTLVHATSGATMLASTAGGVSAAGTVGIMGGTAGAVGTGASILMSPIVIGGAAVGAIGGAGMEGVCYFQDERVTDFDKVFELLLSMSQNSEDKSLQLQFSSEQVLDARFLVRNLSGEYSVYNVSDLYIVNGELWNSDWLGDTYVGNVGFQQLASGEN